MLLVVGVVGGLRASYLQPEAWGFDSHTRTRQARLGLGVQWRVEVPFRGPVRFADRRF